MRSRTKFILLALASLTATACGLKGPLYRPGEPSDATVSPATDPVGATKKKQGEPSVTPPDPDRPAVPPGR
jgi:predicted small lipoprotein YifL